jgi:hypothetical protein
MKKKNLIVSGCSFTEGHILGERGTWATYYAKNNNLELYNLAVGGSGNELISQKIVNFATVNPDIASDSIFIIQLSECLRFLVCWDDFVTPNRGQSGYYSLTPIDFLGTQGATNPNSIPTGEGFDDWYIHSPMLEWFDEQKMNIAPLFTNITFSLLKTYNNILSLVNFFERNNYPYFIFEGVNDHIPIRKKNKWYLKDSDGNPSYLVDVNEDEDSFTFFRESAKPSIHNKLINVIKNNPNYYNDITLHDFIYTPTDDSYHKGNVGHANELGSIRWAEHLNNVVLDRNLF